MNDEMKQDVVVVRQQYATNKENWEPVLYEIEINGDNIIGITEESAKFIYQELGKLLFPEKGDKQ